MKIYQVGPDIPYDCPSEEDERFEWLVYWYEDGGYDGSGEAVALGKDGLLYGFNLGHCSCYGPFDSWDYNKIEGGKTKEEFFGSASVLDYIYMEVIRSKVGKLLE